MNNHIFLMIRYINQLMELARAQLWIDEARKVNRNKSMLRKLDIYQDQVNAKSQKIHDEMFEISRSN